MFVHQLYHREKATEVGHDLKSCTAKVLPLVIDPSSVLRSMAEDWFSWTPQDAMVIVVAVMLKFGFASFLSLGVFGSWWAFFLCYLEGMAKGVQES